MGLLKNLLYSASSEKMLNFFTDQTIFTYYHTVNNEKLNYLDNLFSFKNEKHFKNDIELLLNNYQPLNPDFFLKDFKYNQIPKNHFLLTFDDGLSQIFDVIAPILYEKKISAIFFVNPHYIDNKNFFVRHVISVLIDIILNNKYDKVFITYNQFKNAATQIVKFETLLPINSTKNLDKVNFQIFCPDYFPGDCTIHHSRSIHFANEVPHNAERSLVVRISIYAINEKEKEGHSAWYKDMIKRNRKNFSKSLNTGD